MLFCSNCGMITCHNSCKDGYRCTKCQNVRASIPKNTGYNEGPLKNKKDRKAKDVKTQSKKDK